MSRGETGVTMVHVHVLPHHTQGLLSYHTKFNDGPTFCRFGFTIALPSVRVRIFK